MYAKIFTQIFDSSIADNYLVRLVFEDLLLLANSDGVVDMTHEAIARRTNVPIKIVREGIKALEAPDPKSRTPDHEGRRITRLDEHREWGWLIINRQKFRDLVTEEQRREKARERLRRFREKENKDENGRAPATPGNAVKRSETLSNASNARQRQRQRQRQRGQEQGVQGGAGKPAPARGPSLSKIQEAWNEQAKASGWCRVDEMGTDRQRAAKARLLEPYFVANWEAAIERLAGCSFARGGGPRGWKATIDFFLRPGNVARILEGAYDDSEPGTRQDGKPQEKTIDERELDKLWQQQLRENEEKRERENGERK